MLCRQTTADGRQMPDYKFSAKELTSPIGLFFTCELAAGVFKSGLLSLG